MLPPTRTTRATIPNTSPQLTPTGTFRPTFPNTPSQTSPMHAQAENAGRKGTPCTQDRPGSALSTNSHGSGPPTPFQLQDNAEIMLARPAEKTEVEHLIKQYPILHSYIKERECFILEKEYHAHRVLWSLNYSQHLDIKALREAAHNSNNGDKQSQESNRVSSSNEGLGPGPQELQQVRESLNQTIEILKLQLKMKDEALQAKDGEIKSMVAAQGAYAIRNSDLVAALEEARAVNKQQKEALLDVQNRFDNLRKASSGALKAYNLQKQELLTARTQIETLQANLDQANASTAAASKALPGIRGQGATDKRLLEQALSTTCKQNETFRACLSQAKDDYLKAVAQIDILATDLSSANNGKKSLEQALSIASEETKILKATQQQMVKEHHATLDKQKVVIKALQNAFEDTQGKLDAEKKLTSDQTVALVNLSLKNMEHSKLLNDSQANVDNAMKQFEESNEKLEKCKTELQNANAQLHDLQETLRKCHSELEETRTQLLEAKTAASHCSDEIIESQKQAEVSLSDKITTLEKRHSEQQDANRVIRDEEKKEIEGLRSDLERKKESATELKSYTPQNNDTSKTQMMDAHKSPQADPSLQNNDPSKKRKADADKSQEAASDLEAISLPAISQSSLRKHPKKKVRKEIGN
jgi:chromosome segregation ATPase